MSAKHSSEQSNLPRPRDFIDTLAPSLAQDQRDIMAKSLSSPIKFGPVGHERPIHFT